MSDIQSPTIVVHTITQYTPSHRHTSQYTPSHRHTITQYTPSHNTHHHYTDTLPLYVRLLVWGQRSVFDPLVNIGKFLDTVLEFVKRRKVVEERRRVCLQSLQ